MALQEHSSEVNTTPALKSFLHSTVPSVRNLFIFSKTIPFIGGMVVSYKFVEIGVVANLEDYLTDADFMGKTQRIGVVVTNLHDALSSLLYVFVSPIAEACMGYFTMITLCAAASVEGLMLLWMSISTTSVDFPFYAAIFLLALCKSGQMLSENFLEFQLEEKIKAKKEREQDYAGKISKFNIWLLLFNPFLGYGVTILVAHTVYYEYIFMVAALLMGGDSSVVPLWLSEL
ncbi:hypothetical protein Fmac_012272 [Flemingia macrophylla]|uniref:Uncharacterized protein n=1 Tax=Flemingia macrophylla TaxID=520843 RepID=A0ABD1MPV4_9FABA